ncbi:hypothetical protein [Allomuricauda sp. NBRC 101325]|uniref:hypothetical protein n=1 Tax=Allomuricauda sp. NBRC 101325 TaxID=1113758 RepID=UPI0024A46AC8|nr:hypothetical protein [Muricauda sp. NBRC 101325]GLU44416.1 hypothetical protein Musp01_20400 [Muricauda sp. NBRC 101325]
MDFDTFSEMSRNRKTLDRIVGLLLILISLAIAVFLIPSSIPVIRKAPYFLLDPDMGVRGEMWYDLLVHSVGWIIAFFIFRSGRAFLRGSKKHASTNK